MIAWLAARSLLGAPRWLLGAVLLAALAWAGAALVGELNHHEKAQREAGAIEERAAAQAETIKQVEKANAVRQEIRDPGSRARYDECLRSARDPAVCQRFLPQ